MAVINFIRDYQRLARFRFGRFEGMRGPGVVFKLPIVHKIVRVDLRTEVLDIPKQTNITKDNASIDIDFLVYMRVDVNSAEKAVLEVEDHDHPGDRREDQKSSQERVDAGEEPAHVAVKYARTASAPATTVAPVNHARRPRRSAGAYIQGASTASSERVPYR